MGLRSNLNLSEPIVIHWLDARCFAVTEPQITYNLLRTFTAA